MAGNINKVILIGHLGCDPTMVNAQSVEQAAWPGGEIVVSFSLATTESWVDRKSGVLRERTEWHHVAIFNQHLAEVAFRYLRKGSMVYVEGQVQTRLLEDQNGQQRATTEIVLSRHRGELVMLGASPSANGARADTDAELTDRHSASASLDTSRRSARDRGRFATGRCLKRCPSKRAR